MIQLLFGCNALLTPACLIIPSKRAKISSVYYVHLKLKEMTCNGCEKIKYMKKQGLGEDVSHLNIMVKKDEKDAKMFSVFVGWLDKVPAPVVKNNSAKKGATAGKPASSAGKKFFNGVIPIRLSRLRHNYGFWHYL